MKYGRVFSTLAAVASLALALSAPTSAQVVSITGVVKPAGVPSCPGATHVLDCTNVSLAAIDIDLDPFIGQNVRVIAKTAPSLCSLYTVTEVLPPIATLDTCGSPTPGCPMRFRVGPTGVIGQYWLFFSPFADVAPISTTKGTILLSNPMLIASGLTFGADAAVDINLPANTSITGVEIFLQGARRDVGPVGPIHWSNAACFTITGPSPPCFLPDC